MSISDTELLELNALGIIPGPDETEEVFQTRASYCLSLRETLTAKIEEGIPQFDKPHSSDAYLEPSLQATRILYDIMPTWIPLFFSNYKLAPWHGGCAWIFQIDQDSPTAAFLQLRKVFASQPCYLRIYSRKELIAHELCHVGRMCYEEPKFEEILAYRTSHSRFRSWLGAIAQSQREVLYFVFALAASLLADFYSIFENSNLLVWVRLLPLFLLLFGFFRLCKRQTQFKRCLHNLRQIVKQEEKASACIFRLTDAEIVRFSRMNQEELNLAFAEKKDSSLRWRLIHRAYL